MARRIAGRIGKGVSETLQDGLIYIARAHNWGVEKDEDEELDEDEREEVYVLWGALDGAGRRHVFGLLEDKARHEELIDVKAERDRLEESAGFLAAQIDKLAHFIVDEVPGEPSESEGAVDTAIRLIRHRKRLQQKLNRRRAPPPDVHTRRRSDLKNDNWEFAYAEADSRTGEAMAPDERRGWIFVAPYAVGDPDGKVLRGALWRRKRKDDAQAIDDAE